MNGNRGCSLKAEKLQHNSIFNKISWIIKEHSNVFMLLLSAKVILEEDSGPTRYHSVSPKFYPNCILIVIQNISKYSLARLEKSISF